LLVGNSINVVNFIVEIKEAFVGGLANVRDDTADLGVHECANFVMGNQVVQMEGLN
jgi:hypothetical protein